MIGYPLDSHVTYDGNGIPIYDRAVSSAPLRKIIKKLFSDGVMPNPSTNMQVVADAGMNILVKSGFAICNGCMKLEEEQVTLAVQASDASYSRIDTVALRLNDNDAVRSCELVVLTGTPATNPARPALTRNASVWEIGLADIKLPANATSITNANITDTRYETARCGVISSISEFDTTKIYQQVIADLAEFKLEEQADFLAWFDEMKNQLSTDAAGNLQKQIEVERERINNLAKMEEGSTTGDAELMDIRAGADGVIYDSAGEAVRTQFESQQDLIQSLDGRIEAVEGQADYNELRVNAIAQSANVNAKDIQALAANEPFDITIEDVQKGIGCVASGYTVGVTKLSALSLRNWEDHYLCKRRVNAGDTLVVDADFIAASNSPYVIIANEEETIIFGFTFTELVSTTRGWGGRYTFAESGYVQLCARYEDSVTEKLFRIERKVEGPLVLDETEAATYLVDPTMGDIAMKAVKAGKQILIRVVNAGGTDLGLYSPAFRIETPMNGGHYIYLKYIKDGMEEVDLTAIGAGKVGIPIISELKLILSEDYYSDPLG